VRHIFTMAINLAQGPSPRAYSFGASRSEFQIHPKVRQTDGSRVFHLQFHGIKGAEHHHLPASTRYCNIEATFTTYLV
jgi:hypothetical protein